MGGEQKSILYVKRENNSLNAFYLYRDRCR